MSASRLRAAPIAPLAAALLLAALAVPRPALAQLQRCEFADGLVRTLAVSPGAFPLTLARCQPVTAPAEPPPAARPAPVVPSVTVIEGPAGAWASAAPAGPVPGLAPDIERLVHRASERYGLDRELLHAIIQVESNGNARARSPAGALGLMQVMPATATDYGVDDPADLLRPEVNIDVGARHVSQLLRRFGDRLDLVVAAYNAGEWAVVRHGMAVPPFPETRQYVQRVLGRLEAAR